MSLPRATQRCPGAQLCAPGLPDPPVVSDPVSCLLQDENVTQLGQELAQKLGLRVRKAYKRPQVGGSWGRHTEEGCDWRDPESGSQSLVRTEGMAAGDLSPCWLKALE